MEPSIQPELEVVACNICQSTATRPFTQRKDMHVVQCIGCGLVYVNPRHAIESMYQHYNNGQSSRIQYYLDVEAADYRTFASILDLAELLVPGRGCVLDIGPNVGTFLALAHKRGWETYGVEINEQAASYCRQRGLNVISGFLDSHTYEQNSFDIVFMGDVIEHVHNPLNLIQIVRSILKPGGVLIISTPDIAGWAARLLQIKPEEHLYYFAPVTMDALLRKAKLEVVGIKCFDRYHHLTAMTHSTTFGGVFQRLGPIFTLLHGIIGDLIVALPLRENLIAVARKPQ